MLILWILLAVEFGFSVVPPAELKALQDLFKTTEGHSWTKSTNWNSGDPCENNWYGIECDSQNEHVRNLQLASNNLGGYLPKNLGDLTKLYMVGLDLFNHIGGELPESLGNCTEMVLLTLEQQKLVGKIPESFNKLENLVVLHLGNNQLTYIPNLGNMGKSGMQSFVIANNNINGELLPSEGPSASQCDLSGNGFKCPIPSWASGCKASCT